jgi:AcrR family transcriptional regulator
MSIEEVAARAGVGKATIYRRWPSKGVLALDAFVAAFREQQPLPDTGTLRGDLVAALTAWVRLVTGTAMGPMLTGLIAEAQHDPGLRAAWRERVLEPLRSQHRIMLDRAIARGELPATVDQEVVLDLFFGGRPAPAAARSPAADRRLHPLGRGRDPGWDHGAMRLAWPGCRPGILTHPISLFRLPVRSSGSLSRWIRL